MLWMRRTIVDIDGAGRLPSRKHMSRRHDVRVMRDNANSHTKFSTNRKMKSIDKKTISYTLARTD
jgi:hypothetical protein